MCLAVPSRIVCIDRLVATIDVHGARKDVSLLLMPEDVSVGDYVIVHAGFAIQKLDNRAAEDAIELINEVIEKSQ